MGIASSGGTSLSFQRRAWRASETTPFADHEYMVPGSGTWHPVSDSRQVLIRRSQAALIDISEPTGYLTPGVRRRESLAQVKTIVLDGRDET